MVRSFAPTPVPSEVLDRVLRSGLRAPSAGNTQGTDLVVLEGVRQTERYWDVTLPAERRVRFPWPGLLAAPILIIPVVSPAAYAARYSEPDKRDAGLASAGAWRIPYWYVDAAFVAMLVQLAAIDEGLGVLFFGVFEYAAALCRELGVPDGHEPIGTIAVGYPDSDGDRPSGSVSRHRRTTDEVVHRGGW